MYQKVSSGTGAEIVQKAEEINYEEAKQVRHKQESQNNCNNRAKILRCATFGRQIIFINGLGNS